MSHSTTLEKDKCVGWNHQIVGCVLAVLLMSLPIFANAAELTLSAQQPNITSNAASSTAAKPGYRSVDGKSVYIVQLADPAVATYSGGIGGMAATTTTNARLDVTSAASVQYKNYLSAVQDALIQHCEHAFARNIDVPFTYQHAYNGVAMDLTPEEAKAIATMANVARVTRERFEVPTTDNGPIHIGARSLWRGNNTPGYISSMGEGAVVAIFDSGINFDHPSFADIGGDGYDHENPLGSGSYLPGSYCDLVDPSFCNDKLIGAWAFTRSPADPVSPDDTDGHGSHTASTAAGNVVLDATIEAPTTSYTNTISGVAPHANIIAYDVCIDSCPGSALLAAIEQVVIDSAALPEGIHALNYSISGGNDPYNDPIEIGFLNATAAGIFVSAAAGNEGPGAGTSAHNSPWVTSVAASTHKRDFAASVQMLTSDGGVHADLQGAALAAGYGPAPIVYAGDFPTANGSANDTDPAQCLDPFPAGHFAGEIVVCDRGAIARTAKGENVLTGGAGGYVLANAPANGEEVVADPHVLPAVHLGATDGAALKAWIAANTNTVAQLSGYSLEIDPSNADIMADFSSRGPNAIDVLKPDVSAPGVRVLAAYASGVGIAPPEYNFLSGTSMASPHNAGAGALLRKLTDWTPYEIKSALVLTAKPAQRLLKEDGVTPADPFDVGGGRINLNRILDAGIVLSERPINMFLANPEFGGDPKTLNLASMQDSSCIENCSWTRTITNKSPDYRSFRLRAPNRNGMRLSVQPQIMSLPPGASESMTVQADTRFATAGWTFSDLVLDSKEKGIKTMRMPIAVLPQSSSAPALFTKTVDKDEAARGEILRYQISVTNGPIEGVIDIEDELPVNVVFQPGSENVTIINGVETSPFAAAGSRLTWSGQLAPGGIDVIEGAAPAGFLPLSTFGVDPLTTPSNPDDGGVLLDLPAFQYNGSTYTDAIMSVNGTLEVGTASLASTPGAISRLPDANAPNNLLAPFWADLDLTSGGDLRVGLLNAGPDQFIVFEWSEVPLFADSMAAFSFQVWILAGTDQIWFTYGPLSTTDISLTVGAEDETGSFGDSYFHNSDGMTPEGTAPSADLQVVRLNGGSAVIEFDGKLKRCDRGTSINRATLSADLVSENAISITRCVRK